MREHHELEFSDEQLAKIDEIYNETHSLCKVLSDDENLEWDMILLGEIAEFAAEHLASCGIKVHFPSIVTDGDNEVIRDFYE